MYELREALAAVLGIAVGLLFVAYPGLVLRVQRVGRVPRDRGGRYGESGGGRYDEAGDADDADALGGVWLWLFRALGAAFVLGGAYFAVRPWLA